MLKFLVFDCLENSLFSLFISGAITSATIQIDEGSAIQVRDRSALLSVQLDGLTTGARYTSITWTRNGTALSNMNPVSGVPNSQIFIGGGEERVGGNPCEDRMYRPAILLRGYLPGVYRYSVTNADTPGDVQSPTLTISGMFINSSVSQLFLFHLQVNKFCWTAK